MYRSIFTCAIFTVTLPHSAYGVQHPLRLTPSHIQKMLRYSSMEQHPKRLLELPPFLRLPDITLYIHHTPPRSLKRSRAKRPSAFYLPSQHQSRSQANLILHGPTDIDHILKTDALKNLFTLLAHYGAQCTKEIRPIIPLEDQPDELISEGIIIGRHVAPATLHRALISAYIQSTLQPCPYILDAWHRIIKKVTDTSLDIVFLPNNRTEELLRYVSGIPHSASPAIPGKLLMNRSITI